METLENKGFIKGGALDLYASSIWYNIISFIFFLFKLLW